MQRDKELFENETVEINVANIKEQIEKTYDQIGTLELDEIKNEDGELNWDFINTQVDLIINEVNTYEEISFVPVETIEISVVEPVEVAEEPTEPVFTSIFMNLN